MEGDEVESGPFFRRSSVDTKVSGKHGQETAQLNIFSKYCIFMCL